MAVVSRAAGVFLFCLWEEVLAKGILFNARFGALVFRLAVELGFWDQAHMELPGWSDAKEKKCFLYFLMRSGLVFKLQKVSAASLLAFRTVFVEKTSFGTF